MTLTAITATFNRPDAMRLCTKYLARQTRQPDQHLVLDGPEPMATKVLAAIEAGNVHGEVVVWTEDDDWFRSDWLEWCHTQISRGYDIAGEGNAVYYSVRHRWHSECKNVRHAALCQTAVHRDMLPQIANVIGSYNSQFFDTRIWQLDGNKHLALPKSPAERRVIGIKGVQSSEGKPGYSGEHSQRMPEGAIADPALAKLWDWTGDDAFEYLRFREQRKPHPLCDDSCMYHCTEAGQHAPTCATV